MAEAKFNPDQYLKEKMASAPFDPDEYLKAKGIAPTNTSVPQTALEHFGNGAALGYLPQLQALAEPVTNAIGNLVTGQNIQADPYVNARDKNIARMNQEAKDNPYTAGLSTAAGGLASGIATSGILPAPAATAGGRIAQMAKVGATLGAVANPGDAKGELNPVQAPQRIENAAKAIPLSVLLAGLVETPALVKSGFNSAQSAIANKLGQNVEYTPVANKGAVEAAAKNLGIDSVPKAVLTDNPTFQKLESGLSQSGSLPAKSIRDQYSKFFKGVDAASEKISNLKTPESDFLLGKQIQVDLAAQVNDSRAPVSEMYNELQPDLQKIEVNPSVVNKAFGSLKGNPLFQTKDGRVMLDEYQAVAKSQPELASLKEWRSTLGDSLGQNSTPLDAKRIDAITDAVTSIRDNSIEALKAKLPKEMHGEIDNFIDQVALADAAHVSNIKDVNAVKSLVGNKDFKSPINFLNKLGDAKEADLAQRAGNLDVSTLQNLREKYPSVFEKAKAAKINDMIQGSTNPVSGFNESTFLKKYSNLDQELKDLIFDSKTQNHIESLQTLKQAIPPKLGPSGTPEGQMMMDMINPKRNVLDYGIKTALEATANKTGAQSVSSVAPAVSKGINPVILSLTSLKDKNLQPTQTQGMAADNQDPKKGPDKWVNDGLKKLEDHAEKSDQQDVLEKYKGAMMKDERGKKMLIAASDLKPGSKAMEQLLTQIKNRYGKGDQ